MHKPTPRQVQALYHVECFTAVYGREPSYRELAALLGLTHPRTAWRVVGWRVTGGRVAGCRNGAIARLRHAPGPIRSHNRAIARK